jgi:hypothetical protein
LTTAILPSAYFPSICYFQLLLKGNAIIDRHEHFVKQSMRNRTQIYSANGILDLSIPLKKSDNHTPMCEKRISYQDNWKTLHWRSIASAYNGSAYFEYFEDALKPLFDKNLQIEKLVDWNDLLLHTIFDILRINVRLNYSLQYFKSDDRIDQYMVDLRNENETAYSIGKPYYQIFSDKHGFIPNLSFLDLLFHQGLKSLEYL